MAKGKMPGMGSMGNMSGMMKQVQKMQEDMQNTQKEIEETTFEASSGGGAVKVKISGKRVIEEIILDPEILVPEDAQMVSDMIMAAINQGLKEVEETTASRLGALTGGLNIPGLF